MVNYPYKGSEDRSTFIEVSKSNTNLVPKTPRRVNAFMPKPKFFQNTIISQNLYDVFAEDENIEDLS